MSGRAVPYDEGTWLSRHQAGLKNALPCVLTREQQKLPCVLTRQMGPGVPLHGGGRPLHPSKHCYANNQ